MEILNIKVQGNLLWVILEIVCVFLFQVFELQCQKTLLSVKPIVISVTVYYNSMKQTGIWIRCNFNYLKPDNQFLYLFNNSLKQYDDTRRGPHLNLEVQKSLYSGLYTGQNVNQFQARFCHHLWKIRLFIFLPSKLESWTTYFVCSSNCT